MTRDFFSFSVLIINITLFSIFQIQNSITPHTIVTLPNSNGMQLLLCYDNEGVYVNTSGKVTIT